MLFDGITTGSPLYSLTGTQKTVETLKRQTGPVDLVLYGPRRLGEILQWPGMVGALGGVILGFAFLRRRSALGIAAAVLSLGAFALLACAGLAIIARYTMLAAAVLAIFVALALLGWRLLEPGHPWRRRWQALRRRRPADVRDLAPQPVEPRLQGQHRPDQPGPDRGRPHRPGRRRRLPPSLRADLVPNHRAVPRLAFGLDVKPTQIVSATEQGIPRHGYFVDPASPFVIHNFILDPNDPTRFSLKPPPGFRYVTRNRSWKVYRRC